jgi:hypothetical protein
MFASVRIYDGVTDIEAVSSAAETRIAPLLQKHDGMVSYTLVSVGHGSVISIGIFETREQAAEANRMVRELAQTEFKHLMPRLPIARVGEIVGHFGK